MLWLPPGPYSLDARTKFGIVSSDVEGAARNSHLIGESFTRADPPPSHRLRLRMGFGGITLKEILPESQAPALPLDCARRASRFTGFLSCWCFRCCSY